MAKATEKVVAGKTHRAPRKTVVSDAVANAARAKQLLNSATALVNAHNAEDTAGDAVSAARINFFGECKQSYGSKFYDDATIRLQPRVIFYKAHYASKGLDVSVSINPSRNELKVDAIDASQAEKVKAQVARAGTRWNDFLTWCRDEVAGKHEGKDPNNRQSKPKRKRDLAEVVQKEGARVYNACYKEGMVQACSDFQAWATKYFKSKVKFAVPAGAKK